jgi:drug/metabolite transporter (DMT)-like permease
MNKIPHEHDPSPSQQARSEVWSGACLAVLGTLAFSAKAIVVKLAYMHGVDATTVVAYRMLFALPPFALLAWWTSRGKEPLSRHDLMLVSALGVFGGYLTTVLDFAGLVYITASLERLIIYLTPTLVLLMNFRVFRRTLRWQVVCGLALCYAGAIVVFGREAMTSQRDAILGSLLCLGSAFTYAVYLTGASRVVQRIGAARLAGFATTIACVLSLFHFVLLKPISAFVVPEPVIWLSLINGTACTFAPILMTMMAIERIGAPLFAQVSMLGPVSTISLGVVVLGEPFTPLVASGSLLVLVGVWLTTTRRRGARGRHLDEAQSEHP